MFTHKRIYLCYYTIITWVDWQFIIQKNGSWQAYTQWNQRPAAASKVWTRLKSCGIEGWAVNCFSEWSIMSNIPVVLWKLLKSPVHWFAINLWCVILINGGMFVTEPSIREGSRRWADTYPPQRRQLHYAAPVWWWFCFCPVLHVTLHVACRVSPPSPLPQTPAASLAPLSTMPCVGLGVSWAAASHTQQWCPSTLSSAACRFVWKLNLIAASGSSSPSVAQGCSWTPAYTALDRIKLTFQSEQSAFSDCCSSATG